MSPPNKYIKPNYDLINRNLPFHRIAALAGSTPGIGHISCTVKQLCGITVKPHQLLLFKLAPWGAKKSSWGLSTTNSLSLTVRARKDSRLIPLSFLLFIVTVQNIFEVMLTVVTPELLICIAMCVCVSMCPPSHSLSRRRKQTCFISPPMARCHYSSQSLRLSFRLLYYHTEDSLAQTYIHTR